MMRLTGAALSAALFVGACATGPSPSDIRAPQPAKPVDAERLYSGRWLEIGRTPMRLTDGCVAGASNYRLTGEPNRIDVRDTCEVGQPGGRERGISGRGEILDPGTNAKYRVRYPFFITWDYWVLDRADDYSWFIAADPTLSRLFIYSRDVPTGTEREALTARAAALGYDTTNLEFPAHAD